MSEVAHTEETGQAESLVTQETFDAVFGLRAEDLTEDECITINALVRVTMPPGGETKGPGIVNLALLARLSGYNEARVFAWVRRARKRLEKGRAPAELPLEARQRLTHVLFQLGVTVSY